MSHRIPVAGPWITQREIDYVTGAVTHAWFGKAHEYHVRFEKTFANYVGVPYAMALPSCTAGIHLALASLGIGPGDEVIVPELTWIATAAPISYVGATPVFVDVDPITWCISPSSLEAAITSHTKAIITVDLYGNMADYDRILAIARKHNLRVIEDAAEAVGARYKGRAAGSFGDVAVFSFHGSKTLTTGEGGMLVTNNTSLFDRANFLRDHGRVPGDFSFENSEVAFKYKMSAMQAALGLAQTERIGELMSKKREIFGWYKSALSNLKGVQINSPGENVEAAYWMVSIVWDKMYGVQKDMLINHLKETSIESRPFFNPLSSLKAYAALSAKEWHLLNPNSYDISKRGINLPSSLQLTEMDVDRVCQCLAKVFQ